MPPYLEARSESTPRPRVEGYQPEKGACRRTLCPDMKEDQDTYARSHTCAGQVYAEWVDRQARPSVEIDRQIQKSWSYLHQGTGSR